MNGVVNKNYLNNKKWRLTHTKARNKQRTRYYAQFQDSDNRGERWSIGDLLRILEKPRVCDRLLSERLGRSVKAIQIMRSDYRNRQAGRKLLALLRVF